jgi:hypothetical protein
MQAAGVRTGLQLLGEENTKAIAGQRNPSQPTDRTARPAPRFRCSLCW